MRNQWQQFLEDQLGVVDVALPEEVGERRNLISRRLDQQVALSVQREIDTVDKIGRIRFGSLEDRYQQVDGLRRAGVRLLEGVPRANQEDAVAFVMNANGGGADDGDGSDRNADTQAGAEQGGSQSEGSQSDENVQVSYRFPDASLNLFEDAAQRAVALQENLESFIADFEDEPEYIGRSEPVQAHLSSAQDLLTQVRSTDSRLAELVVEAENQIARSRNFRDEANDLIAEARRAVQQEEIEEARSLVERARDRFFEAWDLQQDVAARRNSDQLIQQLGDEILEAENRIVVRRTRQLVQQAEELYDNERYQQAFDVLARAEETWGRTHANDPNPEVQSLLRYVNAALSLAGSRELTETEPLYPVLSNYLFVAREDYAEAQALIDDGRSRAADQRLVRADENLTNVTAVRPLNWEARVLKLRILQLQSAENFDEIFQRRYEDALDQRDENPEEALTALETLAALNPDYPGLQNAIVDLEIELGIRPDPVTQAQLARSNELYQEAQSLVQEGGQAQQQAAISLLEEALSLNPENDQAKILLDELRIGLGGRATIALSSEDEQLFRRAERLFVQNQVAQAYAIVQRLLQNENNQLYAPLLELERRITARLGI